MKKPIEVCQENEENRLYVLVFLTNACNYKCWYCYNDKCGNTRCINIDFVYKFIIRLMKYTCRKLFINFIGGEPTLHSSLFTLLSRLQNIPDAKCAVITNLAKTIDYYADLCKFGCIITASYHPEFAEKDEFIHKVVYLEQNFQKRMKDIIVMLDPKRFKQSIDVFDNFKKKTSEVNVELAKIDNYVYDAEQVKLYEERMQANRRLYTIKYNDKTVEHLSFDKLTSNSEYIFKNWKCNAGLDLLYVHSNGDIYNCESYFEDKQKSLGSIYNLDDFNFNLKPTICKCSFCSGDFHIYKQKIF